MPKSQTWLAWILAVLFVGHLFLVIRYFIKEENPSYRLLHKSQHVYKGFGDFIFVPGSGCNPGIGTQERLATAAIYFKFKKRPIFLSEGTCSNKERHDFFQVMDSLGIDTNMVFWDTSSYNSIENVRQVSKWAKRHKYSSLIVCTSGFHQRRMYLLMNIGTELNFRIAKMPDDIEMLSKLSPYKERLPKYVNEEWKKVLFLSLFN